VSGSGYDGVWLWDGRQCPCECRAEGCLAMCVWFVGVCVHFWLCVYKVCCAFCSGAGSSLGTLKFLPHAMGTLKFHAMLQVWLWVPVVCARKFPCVCASLYMLWPYLSCCVCGVCVCVCVSLTFHSCSGAGLCVASEVWCRLWLSLL
jgi:hypothetical protein